MRFGFLAAVMGVSLLLPSGCKRKPDPATASTRPAHKAVSVTFGSATRPVETDPARLLFQSLIHKDAAKAQELLKAHPTLARQKLNGMWPLHMAAACRSLPLIKTVVECKPDLTVRDFDAFTALRQAVFTDCMEVAKYLVEQGMDPKVRGGLDPATGKQYEETLLWSAQSKEMVAYLISLGVDPKTRDMDGSTALHSAAARSRRAVAEALLDAGLEPDSRGRWNMTPLHAIACRSEDDPRPVARLLLDRGAKVDARGFRGRTALHEAAFANRYELAKLVLEAGADVNAKDDDGKTPIELCREAGPIEDRKYLINLLIKYGAPGTMIPTRHAEP